ncbi:MAG: ATP-binding protein, partial [Pseudomonadota bacterium]
TIPFAIHGKLPEEPVSLDATQFEQVMINLLKNAHESGSDPAAVEVAVRHIGNEALVTVRDHGGGIDDDVLRHALLPFYSTKKSGTGLGLPLCREIVEAHGGRLSLANVDEGLEVRIALPRARLLTAAAGAS